MALQTNLQVRVVSNSNRSISLLPGLPVLLFLFVFLVLAKLWIWSDELNSFLAASTRRGTWDRGAAERANGSGEESADLSIFGCLSNVYHCIPMYRLKPMSLRFALGPSCLCPEQWSALGLLWRHKFEVPEANCMWCLGSCASILLLALVSTCASSPSPKRRAAKHMPTERVKLHPLPMWVQTLFPKRSKVVELFGSSILKKTTHVNPRLKIKSCLSLSLHSPLLQASCGDSMPSFHASEGHLLQHCIVEYTHTPSYTQKRGYGRGSKHLEIPCFSPQNSFYPVDVHPILIPRGPCSAPPNAGGRPKGTAGADLSHFVSKEKAAPREPIYKLRLKTRT